MAPHLNRNATFTTSAGRIRVANVRKKNVAEKKTWFYKSITSIHVAILTDIRWGAPSFGDLLPEYIICNILYIVRTRLKLTHRGAKGGGRKILRKFL